jgi:hypothetical protein
MGTVPEKGEASGSAAQGGEQSLDELSRSLNIKGDDIGDVFVPKVEVETLKEETSGWW